MTDSAAIQTRRIQDAGFIFAAKNPSGGFVGRLDGKLVWLVVALLLAEGGATLRAQALGANRLMPNLESNIDRPLRYRPDNGDFVIENGGEFFNRSLYGGNTAFRVDGGDKPEFVLYLPGRGGNLRLGVRTTTGARWLHEAAQITTRYRPGELLYEIRDPLLGAGGVIRLAALAWEQTEGLVVRVETTGLPPDVELVWAYGGVNGQRGTRDGDIGTERVPIGQYFQLQPEFCRDNVFELAAGTFTLRAKAATLAGLAPAGATLTLGDAANWNNLTALLASSAPSPALPVLVGRAKLGNDQPLLLSLQRLAADTVIADELSTYKEVSAVRPGQNRDLAKLSLPPVFPAADLPRLFTETEAYFAALRHRVSVETPDPYLNAAVGALNVAADAVWDEPQQAIMHGAIAWRTKLLGWRGPYVLDALGWHDRMRANLTYWAGRQNTDPIPEKIPPADTATNLARNEAGLHSNGDISNSHYDMNTVFIDGLFRHLLWTGDLAFAKKMWPLIERHLAWERRLFRREFATPGGEKLPLYEAYAVIWASDDLQYSGGGAAHSSAYNYWHNTMAARLAPLVDADPAPYTREAGLILRGMRELLWSADLGMFAESKDLLGLQRVHPSAALWTFYHTIDSGVPTPQEAWQMTRYVDAHIPRLPVRGAGVPDGLHTLATSDWMPYTWSINNVVMAEAVHAALGYWQAGRSDEAWHIAKGSLLAAMFMGISPGNVGSMSCYDVYRREAQRDFADGSGVLSRALVEGLFGVRPDALAGELKISPGFPEEWPYAKLHHPQLDFSFARQEATETYTVDPHFDRPLSLRLQIVSRGDRALITVNGQPAEGKLLDGPAPRWEIQVPSAAKCEVRVTWNGQARRATAEPPTSSKPWSRPAAWDAPVTATNSVAIDLASHFNDRVTEIFKPGKYLSPRSPFVSLAVPTQGIGYWAGHVNATAEIDDTGLRATSAAHGGRIILPNGVAFATPGPGTAANILFVSQWDNYPRSATLPLSGQAHRLHLLMAGSTNAMQSRLDNGEVVVTYTDGTTSRLALRNPETWWPIEQDYFIDDYQFRVDAPLPIRVDLKTGAVRALDPATFKGKGKAVPGGAATVLDLPLDAAKKMQSLTVRALANDVVIGLMAATLEQ